MKKSILPLVVFGTLSVASAANAKQKSAADPTL